MYTFELTFVSLLPGNIRKLGGNSAFLLPDVNVDFDHNLGISLSDAFGASIFFLSR